MIPATAGEILTENRLRAFVRCSEFYHLGGNLEESSLQEVVRSVYENTLASIIRRPDLDPLHVMNKAAYRLIKATGMQDTHMQSQVTEFHRHTLLIANEIFTTLPLAHYTPVFGPFTYITRVSKTPIELRISGLLRSKKNKALHVVSFSPYREQHSVNNDPITQLKLTTLKHAVPPHNNRKADCRMHSFGTYNTGTLFYRFTDTSHRNPEILKQITTMVRIMEQGFRYPITPCPHNCKFKEICQIGEKK
jgi:hypothetical protein